VGAPTDWSCKEAGAGSRYRVYDPGDRNDEGNSSYRSRSHSYNRTSGPRPESRSNVHDDDIFHTVIRDTVVPDTVVPDTVVPDTVVPDTIVPDTVVPDTVIPDTVVPDTIIPDTVIPDTVILYGRIFLQRRKRHLGRQRVSCN
jgi:hypothetical protein